MAKKTSNIINDSERKYLRDKIIEGAKAYKNQLLNKKFLILCEDDSIYELVFHKKDFQHLTGLSTDLKDKRFFENSSDGILSENNILENQHYNYRTLKSKADSISSIDRIIYNDTESSLFMINLHTNTCDFPVAIRNSTFNTCVGFTGNDNHARTLRKYSNSQNCDSEKRINVILSKEVTSEKYEKLVYVRKGVEKFNINEDYIDTSSEIKDIVKYIA